ncbi:hypothetical protein ASG25_21115 [Rhizobium sp. Leaf384]|nr:hypothetical protein ASG25_21115 [Rhizobium sp. Leaf384]KQS83942.1 hypothetical protein ASG58_21495 [Rhizobium sp. Leaf383]
MHPPKAGEALANAYLRNNQSRFKRFVAELKPLAETLATEAGELAVSVEQHRITTTTKTKALSPTREYKFALSFPANVSHVHLATACDNGALKYLASIQMLVSVVIQMHGVGYALNSWKMKYVLSEIEEDAAIVKTMVEDALR